MGVKVKKLFKSKYTGAQIEASLDAYKNFAGEYTEKSYPLGSIVLHDNGLFRSTVAITTPEVWTPAHWESITLADLVAESLSIEWGEILGDIDDQTDLKNALGAKVSGNAAITGGTHTKITYDSKGLVTGGASLSASDIPNLPASKITTGTFADNRIASANTWNEKYDKPDSGIPKSDLASAVQTSLGKADGAQPLLVSGTNIKTVNGNSLLGSGNIEIQGGGTSAEVIDETLYLTGAVEVIDETLYVY